MPTSKIVWELATSLIDTRVCPFQPPPLRTTKRCRTGRSETRAWPRCSSTSSSCLASATSSGWSSTSTRWVHLSRTTLADFFFGWGIEFLQLMPLAQVLPCMHVFSGKSRLWTDESNLPFLAEALDASIETSWIFLHLCQWVKVSGLFRSKSLC